MAPKQFSRTGETSTSTGTGAKTLAGALAGYKEFSDVLSNGDTIDVLTILDTDWEIARCTWASAGDTLTPAYVHASSNVGSAVNFGAGTKTIVAVAVGLSDLDATGIANLLTLLGFSAFVQTLKDDADATAFLATLGVAIAAQSDQEAGSDATKLVTSARQQFHPSAAKGWAKVNTGTTISASYNVSSVTDLSAGNTRINWDTDFSSSDYAVVATARYDTNGNRFSSVTGQAAGSTDVSALSNTGSLSDPDFFMCAAFGDQ